MSKAEVANLESAHKVSHVCLHCMVNESWMTYVKSGIHIGLREQGVGLIHSPLLPEILIERILELLVNQTV